MMRPRSHGGDAANTPDRIPALFVKKSLAHGHHPFKPVDLDISRPDLMWLLDPQFRTNRPSTKIRK
jgi:hypothetical protein